MVDRLAELRRQRALISEHLVWLDGEIARLAVPPEEPQISSAAEPPPPRLDGGSHPFPVPQPAVANSPLPAASIPPAATSGDADPDRLLEEFRPTPNELKADVRKGCLLYFIAAFLLLALGIGVLYLTIGSR